MCNFSTRTYQPKDAPECGSSSPGHFPVSLLLTTGTWEAYHQSMAVAGGGGCHGTEDLVLTVHTHHT